MGISILYVDDEEDLCDIASRFLGLHDIQVVSTESAQKALEILKTTRFDAIVSDYQMPILDGLKFLSELNSREIDIPVILFTGRGREEVAIEAFNRGATFYVQKGTPITVQFSELIHKIKIAVDRDRTKKALKESEQRYRSFFTHTLMGSAILDSDYHFLEVNDRLCEIFGYTREELTEKSWDEIMVLEIPIIQDPYPGKTSIQDISVGKHIIKCRKKNGEQISARIACSPIREKETISRYSLLVDDISEQISADETRRLNELRLSVMTDLYQMNDESEDDIIQFVLNKIGVISHNEESALFFVNPDGSIKKQFISNLTHHLHISDNAQISEIFPSGVAESLKNGFHVIIDTLFPESPPLPDFIPSDSGGRAICIPYQVNGRTNFILVNWKKSKPYTDNEIQQTILFLHGFYDFFTRIQAEKNLKERYEELVESWNLVAEHANSTSTVLNALDDSGILIDPKGTILNFNQKAADFFQISDQKRHANLCDVLPNEVRTHVWEGISIARETGTYTSISVPWNDHMYRWNIHPIKGTKDSCGRLVIFCRDITSIRVIEEELEQSKERYKQFIEFLPQAFFEIDTDGKILYLNPYAKNHFGISSSDNEINFRYEDFFAEKNLEFIRTRFLQALIGLGGKGIETEIIHPSGKIYPVFIKAIPITHKNTTTGLRGFVIDLSDIRKEERARRDIEEKYRTLIENSREIIIVSQDGNIKFVNPLGARVTGYSLEELLDKPFSSYIHPDDRQLVYDNYLKRLSGENYLDDYIFRFIDRENIIHWVKTNAIRILWEEKPATLNMLSDISDLIHTQEALTSSENRLTHILEFLPDPSFAIDDEGTIIFWNQAIERLLQVPATNMVGKSKDDIAKVLYGEKRPLLVDILNYQEKQFPENYLILELKDDIIIADVYVPSLHGKPAYLWGKATHLYDQNHQVIGAIESIRDITDRKEIEDNLRTVNLKLNLFSSITRHDIRNQLTLILLAVDTITTLTTDERVKEQVQKIDRTATRINEFIDLAREFQDIGISAPVWKPIMETFQRSTTGLRYNLKKGVICNICYNIQIYADPLLEKVFFNIADNAVKYGTPDITLTIDCQITETGLTLIIEDDGPGVPPEEKDQIFTKGYGKGTGLGLFLVREILSITGMEIKERGKFGEGARFEIFVPNGRYKFITPEGVSR